MTPDPAWGQGLVREEVTGNSKVTLKEKSEMIMILFYKDHPGSSKDR